MDNPLFTHTQRTLIGFTGLRKDDMKFRGGLSGVGLREELEEGNREFNIIKIYCIIRKSSKTELKTEAY